MRNKKKILLIVIPIVVVLIIVAVVAVLYFTTDLFKSNKELFWKYLAQNEDITNILKNDKFELQSQFKQNNTYTANGNLSFTIEQGENSFKELNIATSARHDANTNRTYADATLKNGDIDLFQVSYINCDDIYAIKCDEVFANYVGVKNSGLKELAAKYEVNNIEGIPDNIDINQYITSLEITDAQKQHILDTYFPIITNNILDNQYTKINENIQISGNSYAANVYKVQLTGENVKQIIISCLNTLKTDTETLVLISNKLSTLGFGIEYTDIVNLTSKIDELISQIQQTTMEDNMNIFIYESNESTIRTIVEIENNMTITYDRGDSNSSITLDVTRTNNNNMPQNVDANEIISLDNQVNEGTSTTSRIVISKTTSDNLTTNNVQIVPDLNTADSNISVDINLGSVQNNSINNYFTVIFNSSSDGSIESTTINYNNSITKTEQVEEIAELNNSNTAIANNYSAEEFSTFITSWMSLFSQKLTEKLSVLGFESNM